MPAHDIWINSLSDLERQFEEFAKLHPKARILNKGKARSTAMRLDQNPIGETVLITIEYEDEK